MLMEVAVIGGQDFILGFQLTGIRHVVEAQADPTNQFLDLRDNEDIGIIITDDSTVEKVQEHERYLLERAPKPILITLSTSGAGQEQLRKMIRQAIGVDILKEE